jgi:Mediator of RNA polymerase II transcription subunit 1
MGSAGNTRTLIIAGSVMALDIDFSSDVVKKVSLSFPESAEIVTRHTQQAGDILLRDLQFAPKKSPLTKMLDRFAANLERLATLDKLSVIPGLNCHEAIAGIYESLERLHKWEAARLKEQDDMAGKDDEYVGRTAMCTKSGKPVMHTRDRLGLSIDYWQEKRRLTSTGSRKGKPNTWSLLVECSTLPNYGYRPLRVSEKWISSEILKAEPEAEELMLAAVGGPVLDWLEPESTMLPATEPSNADAMEGLDRPPDGKFPEVMFVAKFDPPIVVPYGVAVQVHSSTSAQLDIYQMSTFDGLLFPQGPDSKAEAGEARLIKQQKAVPIYTKQGEKSTRIHNNTLFVDKVDYGQTLSELPFSHPRQLVEMLPHLRQYAFLATVLKNSFRAEKAVSEEEKESQRATRKEKFADFMAKTPAADETALTVDVSLVTQPPSLNLVFPFKDRTANVKFDIKPNGAVEVKEQNVLDENAMDEGKALTVSDLGRILEVTEDLGVWAEYVTEMTR